MCRQKKPQIIAISLETALQNGGIAFVVINMTFVSPYSDVGVLPIIGYFLCSTTPILFLIYVLFLSYKCCTGQTTLKQIREDLNNKKEKSKGTRNTEAEVLELKGLQNETKNENRVQSENLLDTCDK